MREAAGVIDLTAFQTFDIVGPGAIDEGATHVVAQADVRRARSSTRRCWTPTAAPLDLTVMRLGHDQFRVVTGGAHGMADQQWFSDNLPADGAPRSSK